MVPGGLGEREKEMGRRLTLAGRGYQGWVDQWKIMYEVVQGDHDSGLLNCNRGEGCAGSEANFESGMWVGVPKGC